MMIENNLMLSVIYRSDIKFWPPLCSILSHNTEGGCQIMLADQGIDRTYVF